MIIIQTIPTELLEKTFVCAVNNCGKEYRYKYSYERHLRRGHSDKNFCCDYLRCDYKTADKEYLKRHSFIHTNARPFTCSTKGCGKTYKRKSELNRHQIRHKTKIIQCIREGCDETFNDNKCLKRHIDDKHSLTQKPYKCKTCDQSFDTIRKRGYHQRQVHQTLYKPIKCRINNCNKEFKNSLHSNRELRCDHSGCDYVTNKKELIRMHSLIHSDSPSVVCGIDGCVKAFKVRLYLMRHRNTHTIKRFACTESGCRKVFKVKEYLDQHLDSVHSEISCKYEDCKYVCRSKKKYTLHLLRSHGVGPLSCTQPDCDFTTNRKGCLRNHLTKHSNERPFVCDIRDCGKTFKRILLLKSHKRTHYQTLRICHYEGCHMTFNDIKLLKQHINKIHLQITRRYSCEWPECNYTTDKHQSYNNHKRVHN